MSLRLMRRLWLRWMKLRRVSSLFLTLKFPMSNCLELALDLGGCLITVTGDLHVSFVRVGSGVLTFADIPVKAL
jgi:hypothetical protein